MEGAGTARLSAASAVAGTGNNWVRIGGETVGATGAGGADTTGTTGADGADATGTTGADNAV